MLEKRKAPRIKYSGTCILSRGTPSGIETWTTEIVDLSLTGAMLKSPENWPGSVGDTVRISLKMDSENAELKLDGKIRHQSPNTLGIDFTDLDLEGTKI